MSVKMEVVLGQSKACPFYVCTDIVHMYKGAGFSNVATMTVMSFILLFPQVIVCYFNSLNICNICVFALNSSKAQQSILSNLSFLYIITK